MNHTIKPFKLPLDSLNVFYFEAKSFNPKSLLGLIGKILLQYLFQKNEKKKIFYPSPKIIKFLFRWMAKTLP